MWRPSLETEDDAVVPLCLSLYREDPGPFPVEPARIRQTLARYRTEPTRGRVVVLELPGGEIGGYALLASFLSNEHGGLICVVDELYVIPEQRSHGHGTRLFDQIYADRALWPEAPVGVYLEVRPENVRAQKFYARLGFKGKTMLLQRRATPG